MAFCDVCGEKNGSRSISGINICEDCFQELGKIRAGDHGTILKWYKNNNAATQKGKEYMQWQSEYFAEQYGYLNGGELVEDLRQAAIQAEQESREEEQALRSMLITSGFTFDGYRIVKYSGYISGDDAVQVNRGTAILGSATTNTGEDLTNALVKIRRQALKELKKAAYDLGCNAVIGVDFDYITLEPETASISGRTTYLPYVICVTANGNAVIIEKEDDAPSLVNAIWGYKQLLDNGAITLEEFNKLKAQII